MPVFMDAIRGDLDFNQFPATSPLSTSAPQVKSSVGALQVFCQFLHGEGDFVRHLKKMGYVVTHVQSYIGNLRSFPPPFFWLKSTRKTKEERWSYNGSCKVEVVTGPRAARRIARAFLFSEATTPHGCFLSRRAVLFLHDRLDKSTAASVVNDVSAAASTLPPICLSAYQLFHCRNRTIRLRSGTDEFDFHVSNLAVDLRDGVRLTRLMEVVTGEWGLATGLRVPAVSRLQASGC